MAISAQQANTFSNNSIQFIIDRDVRNEITIAESRIRQVAGLGRFRLSYNAQIIGNPISNPQEDPTLNEKQLSFRDHFNNLGYFVGVDTEFGGWLLDWSSVGIEELVSIYSVRTTVTPGAIEQQTISVINNFFSNLVPSANSRTVLVDTDPPSGGDIPESDFGAPDSVFYEYVSIVNQQNDDNHTVGLKNALRASGLGYVDDTRILGIGGANNTTNPANTLDISNGTTTVTITVGGTGNAIDFVNAVNSNPTLQTIHIVADINGQDLLLINNLGGTLIATNNIGDVLGDLFGLSSPQSGVITDNTEVYKFV
jgi:hypothetical protein